MGEIANKNDNIRTALQKAWIELLQLADVSETDNFYHLGGTSITAVSLLVRIEQIPGARPPLLDFLACRTFKEQLELLSVSHVPEYEIPADHALSPWQADRVKRAQEQQASGEPPAIKPLMIDVSLLGPVSIESLTKASQKLLRRHDALRTSYLTAVPRSLCESEDGEGAVHGACGPSGGLGDVRAAGHAERADGEVSQ